MSKLTHLDARATLSVTGEDRVAFLQGLVSNDVAAAAPGKAVWAALLTPQGKWTADFFVFGTPDALLLDVEAAQADELVRKLSRYRLRARVTVERTPLLVHAAWDGPAPAADPSAPDPRLAAAGWRILSPAALPQTATPAEYDVHRLSLGLPDGSRDMEADKSTLLEAGFDELAGVSWTKGCYLGQELTARTKYRGLVKRRLLPVTASGPLPPPGTPVLRDGTDVGTVRSSQGTAGLALLRWDSAAGPLHAGGLALSVAVPPWLKMPDSQANTAEARQGV